MTQTKKNILIGMGVVLLVGSGGFGLGRATAGEPLECPTTEVTIEAPPCEVTVDVQPCECVCTVDTAPAPRCPEVRIRPASVIPIYSAERPWTATLLAGERAAVGSLTWNRWNRLRPSVGVLWTEGRHEPIGECWGYYGPREPTIRTDDGLTALAGVSISF